MDHSPDHIEKVALLNDKVRRGEDPSAKVFVSLKLRNLFPNTAAWLIAEFQILHLVRHYEFMPTDGPERDYGSFSFDDKKIAFRISAYDKTLQYASDDCTNPDKTVRTLSLMLVTDD